MPAVFAISITLTAQDVPWLPVNPAVTFSSTTVVLNTPVSMAWTVLTPAIVQPTAQVVTLLDAVVMRWVIPQPTIGGVRYAPPFVGEVLESGVEVGDVFESPGP